MDFTWVTSDDANAIQNAIVDAKGDLISATAADTPARLAVGTDGQVLTADSTTATGLKWASPSGASFKGCLVYKSTATTLANATNVTLAYDTEVFDTDAFHSTSSNLGRITIPTGLDGKYLFYAFSAYQNNASGSRNTSFYNGTDYFADSYMIGSTSIRSTIYISQVFNLVAGNYLEVVNYQTSGGNLDINGGVIRNYFGCVYLGA